MNVYCFDRPIKFLAYDRIFEGAKLYVFTYLGETIGFSYLRKETPLQFFCNWIETADPERLARFNLLRAEYNSLYELQTRQKVLH